MAIALITLSLILAVNGDLVDDTPSGMHIKARNASNPTEEMTLSLEKILQKLGKINDNHAVERRHSIPEINEKSGVAEALFQGDILLAKPHTVDVPNDAGDEAGGADIGETSRSKRQAVTNPDQLWSGGIVYYYFNDSFGDNLKTIFLKAAELWEKDSCVKFVYNAEATDRILVHEGNGCLSSIGKVGGEQQISLGKNCDSVDIAAHEIGHALGFDHTMSRDDRDKFITVNFVNVEDYYSDHLFGEGMRTLGLPYDYGSIMHYGKSSVSIDKKQPAMLPLEYDYRYTIGSPFVSFVDLAMVNKLYECKKWCDVAEVVECKMGSFPNPRNCSKCVCPGGYGGDRCDERPEGSCGSTLKATLNWTNFTIAQEDLRALEPKEDFINCTYWIESPSGTEIEVELLSFLSADDYFNYDGCVYGGVEIKTNQDQRLTGYRFCSNSTDRTRLRSHNNRVPVITWIQLFRWEVTLSYRYVSKSELRPTPQTVQPFPTTTGTPLAETSFWLSREATRKCVDYPTCPPYVGTAKTCYDQSYITFCPKLCNLCNAPQSTNTATGVSHCHKK